MFVRRATGIYLLLIITALVCSIPKRQPKQVDDKGLSGSEGDHGLGTSPRVNGTASTTALAVFGKKEISLRPLASTKKAVTSEVVVFGSSNTEDTDDINWSDADAKVTEFTRRVSDVVSFTRQPSITSAYQIAKGVVTTLSKFYPAIAPFASVIFGVIDMFMPGNVRFFTHNTYHRTCQTCKTLHCFQDICTKTSGVTVHCTSVSSSSVTMFSWL